MLKSTLKVSFLGFMFLALPLSLSAAEVSYDRYAPIYQETPTESATKKVAANILTYPLELIRWPVDKSLVFIEKNHLVTKARFLYDTLEAQGVTPKLSFSSPGVEIDAIRLTRQKVRFPDLTVKGHVNWKHDRIFDVGTKVGVDRIGGTGVHLHEIIQYQSRPEEHFHGIGSNASRGEGTSFKMETTKLETRLGYRHSPALSTDLKFSYNNINITDGGDGGRGKIDTTFPGLNIAGLDGDEIISFGFEVEHDTRNQQENSTRGGLLRLDWTYNEGLDGSEARYFSYKAEASRYIRLGNDRRVLFLRFYGEHNDETDHHRVPFHQLARLGGFGTYPDLSHPLRGYDRDRFFDESALLFNIEYRYTVYEYRDWKLDTVLFFDLGQVFGEFSELQGNDFKESYGVGFRFSVLNHVVLALEVAHGDEGTNFYVKSSTPF